MKGRKPVDSTAQKIWRAARDLISERGYNITTTKDIAKRAGVSESTVFRLFGNKRGVAIAVMEHWRAWREEAPKAEWLKSCPFHDCALLVAKWFATRLNRTYIRVLLVMMIEAPDLVKYEKPTPVQDFFVQRIAFEKESGTIGDHDPAKAANLLLFAIFAHRILGQIESGMMRTISDADLDHYVAVWLAGVLSRRESIGAVTPI